MHILPLSGAPHNLLELWIKIIIKLPLKTGVLCYVGVLLGHVSMFPFVPNVLDTFSHICGYNDQFSLLFWTLQTLIRKAEWLQRETIPGIKPVTCKAFNQMAALSSVKYFYSEDRYLSWDSTWLNTGRSVQETLFLMTSRESGSSNEVSKVYLCWLKNLYSALKEFSFKILKKN